MLDKENTQDCKNDYLDFEKVTYGEDKVQITKSTESTNFITSGLFRGCIYDCPFCAIKSQYPSSKAVHASMLADSLIEAMSNHVDALPWPKVPDHTHPRLYTYDIGYFCDIGFDYRFNKTEYNKLFNFIISHPKIMGVFSTKAMEYDLLLLQVKKKIRILFSIMPKAYQKLMEPGTCNVEDRIQAADSFLLSDWDVGFLLSPFIITAGYIGEYTSLFNTMDIYIYEKNKYLMDIKFLKLDKNIIYKIKDPRIREMLWNPSIQEQCKNDPNLIVYRDQSKELFSSQISRLLEYGDVADIRFIS